MRTYGSSLLNAEKIFYIGKFLRASFIAFFSYIVTQAQVEAATELRHIHREAELSEHL